MKNNVNILQLEININTLSTTRIHMRGEFFLSHVVHVALIVLIKKYKINNIDLA